MAIDKIEEFCLKILEKIGLKKLANWYIKHKEGIRYLIFGALTTVVNILVYSLLYYIFKIPNATSNVIAWITSIIFAYITNKLYVFYSKTTTKAELLKEIITFVGCRFLTLLMDEAIMIITVDKLGWPGLIMKIITNVIVIFLNFIFSKIFIFKKNIK